MGQVKIKLFTLLSFDPNMMNFFTTNLGVPLTSPDLEKNNVSFWVISIFCKTKFENIKIVNLFCFTFLLQAKILLKTNLVLIVLHQNS